MVRHGLLRWCLCPSLVKISQTMWMLEQFEKRLTERRKKERTSNIVFTEHKPSLLTLTIRDYQYEDPKWPLIRNLWNPLYLKTNDVSKWHHYTMLFVENTFEVKFSGLTPVDLWMTFDLTFVVFHQWSFTMIVSNFGQNRSRTVEATEF